MCVYTRARCEMVTSKGSKNLCYIFVYLEVILVLGNSANCWNVFKE